MEKGRCGDGVWRSRGMGMEWRGGVGMESGEGSATVYHILPTPSLSAQFNLFNGVKHSLVQGSTYDLSTPPFSHGDPPPSSSHYLKKKCYV